MEKKPMKTLSLRAAFCLAAAFSLYTYADGCEYDTQCKGDRICEDKKCVSPQPASQPAKPAEKGFSLWSASPKTETPPAKPPYYCCAEHEKLGPYPNDGSEGKFFQVGDACSGMSRSARRVRGKVCE